MIAKIQIEAQNTSFDENQIWSPQDYSDTSGQQHSALQRRVVIIQTEMDKLADLEAECRLLKIKLDEVICRIKYKAFTTYRSRAITTIDQLSMTKATLEEAEKNTELPPLVQAKRHSRSCSTESWLATRLLAHHQWIFWIRSNRKNA